MSRYGNVHSNQFIRGSRSEHSLESRLKMSATKAVKRLERIIDDEAEENKGAIVAASKILIDKVVPNLTSIEAVVRNETETLDESALVARLQALIDSNPQLASQLTQLKLVDAA